VEINDVKEKTATTGAALPDTQNYGASSIQGANVPIMQVGISGFRMPLRYMTRAQEQVTLETSVTGTVSLAADLKGVNMSRIMRTFYGYEERVFTPLRSAARDTVPVTDVSSVTCSCALVM
jgi:GTP cyclohydrolase I